MADGNSEGRALTAAQRQTEYESLIRAWKETSSDSSFAALYDACLGLLIDRVTHRGVSRDESYDIAAQAFARALDRLHTYDASKANFSTWISRLATNYAADYLKKNKPVSIEGEAVINAIRAREVATPTFSSEEYLFVSAYVPFTLTRGAFDAVVGVFVAAAGRATADASTRCAAELTKANTEWAEFGNATDVTMTLFALLRLSKVTDEDYQRLETCLAASLDFTPVTLLRTLLSAKAAALLVLLCGGTSLQIPPAAVITALTGSKANRRKRKM